MIRYARISFDILGYHSRAKETPRKSQGKPLGTPSKRRENL